jgi:hypothetical protein
VTGSKEDDVSSYWIILRKRVDTGNEIGSTWSRSVESWLWEGLWACRKADYRTRMIRFLPSGQLSFWEGKRSVIGNNAIQYTAWKVPIGTVQRRWQEKHKITSHRFWNCRLNFIESAWVILHEVVCWLLRTFVWHKCMTFMSPYVFTELYLSMTQLYDFHVHIYLQNCISVWRNCMTFMSPCLENCTSVWCNCMTFMSTYVYRTVPLYDWTIWRWCPHMFTELYLCMT